MEVVTALPNYPTGHIFPEFRGSFYRRELWEGIPVHRLWLYPSLGAGFQRLLNYMSFAVTSLFGLARAAKPDYVFVESPPPLLSVPGFIASRLWSVPLIINVSDLWLDAVQQLGMMRDGVLLRTAQALERWSYRKATYVNAVTEGIRSNLTCHKGVPTEKLLFLPNGVDTELFKPTPADRTLQQSLGLEGKKVVLYAGTHGYVHAVDQALYAARLVSGQKDIHFLFVGGGSEKAHLVKLAQELCLENATFLDPVPAEEMPRFISIAFCGLVTLREDKLFEGARPAKTFAIMACAKPVVLTARGEAARLMEEAHAGIVIPPEQPEALAGALLTLVNDPDLACELGRNGRRYVEDKLQWPALVEAWMRQLTGKCNPCRSG